MSKISNTAAYPNATPLIGDYVIGTVASSLETKTFTIGDIIGLVSDNTLSEVLAAGNTATNDIDLTGNLEVDGDVTITIGFPEDAIGDINPTIAISIDGTGYIDVTPNMTISANDNDKITGTISGSFINVTNPLKSIDMTDGVLTINKN